MLPSDHEAAAQQKNDDGGQIDGQGDGRDHGGHDAQDGEADIPGLGVRGSEFFRLEALRIEDADERGSEDALIDDAVQPVDGFLAALEQNPDLPQREEKGAANHGHHAQDAQPQPPVDGEQHHARADDQEKRGNDGGDRLGNEQLDAVHVRGEIGQEFGGRELLDAAVGLGGDLGGQSGAQVSRDALGGVGLHDVLQIVQSEHQERDDEELQH